MPEQGSAGSTRGLWPVYVTLRGCVTYPKIMRAGGERRTQAGWQRPAWVLGRVLGWSKRRGPGEGEKSWREVSWSAGEMLLTGQWKRILHWGGVSELRRPYFGVSNRYPFQPIRVPDSIRRVQFYLACLAERYVLFDGQKVLWSVINSGSPLLYRVRLAN